MLDFTSPNAIAGASLNGNEEIWNWNEKPVVSMRSKGLDEKHSLKKPSTTKPTSLFNKLAKLA